MTNENLKVDDVVFRIDASTGFRPSLMPKEVVSISTLITVQPIGNKNENRLDYLSSKSLRLANDNELTLVNLIKSKQSRIEILESAIREFLSWTCYKDDEPDYLDALQNLRNIMENKS